MERTVRPQSAFNLTDMTIDRSDASAATDTSIVTRYLTENGPRIEGFGP